MPIRPIPTPSDMRAFGSAVSSAAGSAWDYAQGNVFPAVQSAWENVKQRGLDSQQRVRDQVESRTQGLDNGIYTLKDLAVAGDQYLTDYFKANVLNHEASGLASRTSSNYSDVSSTVSSGADAAGFDYLNADLAKHYGMDASAAYGEALQNTAYQRTVADLKAAGLNPVLAMGKVTPATSYVTGDTLSGGAGAGSSGGRTSGNSGKYALSEAMYNLLGAAGAIGGAVVGFKTGKAPYKILNASTMSMLGKQIAQSGAQALSSLGNIFK